MLLAPGTFDGAGAGVPNISANGLPNCSRSSDAFVAEVSDCSAGLLSVGEPNKSTIGALGCEEVGDDRNGLVNILLLLVGDATFD